MKLCPPYFFHATLYPLVCSICCLPPAQTLALITSGNGTTVPPGAQAKNLSHPWSPCPQPWYSTHWQIFSLFLKLVSWFCLLSSPATLPLALQPSPLASVWSPCSHCALLSSPQFLFHAAAQLSCELSKKAGQCSPAQVPVPCSCCQGSCLTTARAQNCSQCYFLLFLEYITLVPSLRHFFQLFFLLWLLFPCLLITV